ncbi:S-adenosyl-L-methionine-dependent methyltransferase [Lipomyces arxii]|uniref:S-adenosyl-L-methionine-dependent methyltransferase n=1 Tax=Lipomyces arxii TaxID=56418 RepID=UPI0034D0006C
MAEAEQEEFDKVHKVYDEIATHFSQTRYKPWPIVKEYLTSLAPGSVGIDVGCGNGKYVDVNPDVFIVATDRSAKLVKLAEKEKDVKRTRYADVGIADGIESAYARERFDFAISIAVVHHFSTPERRIGAVRSILSALSNTGTALVYVWALEQERSKRGWKEGDDQDVLVPWVLAGSNMVYQRYYHLYKQGEIESDVESAGGIVIKGGYERDNWWVIIKRVI